MADHPKGKDIVIEIEKMLNKEQAPMTNRCCIYKVPHGIRKLNKDAYTPRLVSIGPYHHGSPNLRRMESHKLKYFQSFPERANSNLESLVSLVKELEPMIRCCYSENIKHSKTELVKIILVDAGFILELFLRSYESKRTEDDEVPFNYRLILDVQYDLLLFENQLPFFVLEYINNMTFATHPRYNYLSLLELTFHMFLGVILLDLDSESIMILHFTDLLRTSHIKPPLDKCTSRFMRTDIFFKFCYTVSDLHEAGVKFKLNERSQYLLDLEFSGRVLEIPQLTVNDWTEMMFRNMLAFEQCHDIFNSYIADYVTVLDYLINKEKDVDVLVQEGIVLNELGDNKDVAKLVNGLRKNIHRVSFNSHYNHIFIKLNNFYKNPCHTAKAALIRDYCKTPWKTAASIAAVLILIFTFIQTVCSIFQVVH